MGYQILNDDTLDKPRRRPTSRRTPPPQSQGITIQPYHIHIFIITLVAIGLIFWFITSLDFFDDTKEEETILLIGTLEEFNESYQGDIKIFSTDFILITKGGSFNSNSKDVVLTNFTGNMVLINNSILFKGIAKEITYSQNVLNLNYQKFELLSTKKTNIELNYNELNLTFKEGRVKIDNKLNFEFKNTSIVLNEFNTTFSFDGVFSFTGVAESMMLKSNEPQLSIDYVNYLGDKVE